MTSRPERPKTCYHETFLHDRGIFSGVVQNMRTAVARYNAWNEIGSLMAIGEVRVTHWVQVHNARVQNALTTKLPCCSCLVLPFITEAGGP